MTSKFELSIISAESKVFEGKVENILVPGMVGDFLVLANHAPCISSIRPGFITNLISEANDRLSAADTINKDDLGLRKNDLEEALKQA